jgi:hypothetical protein
MKPLLSNDQLIDPSLVQDIFFQIPEILRAHETFLSLLTKRLDNWDSSQVIGDVFLEAFTSEPMSDIYTSFINNWAHAKESIRVASSNSVKTSSSFNKFLENASREHKGKLTMDALLIMPVQRIPRYELLIKELIKHTEVTHPDMNLLLEAQSEVHDLALKINAVEKESFIQEKTLSQLKEIEALIEGLNYSDLTQADRVFLRYDFVSIPGGLGTRKDRCIFLFSDLLLITSIKRKSGVSRKTSSTPSL